MEYREHDPESMSLSELRETVNSADREILAAFIKRMDAVEYIGRYKRRNGMALEDTERERKLIEDKRLDDAPYAEYTKKLLLGLISLSKTYQRHSLNLYLTGMSAEDKAQTAASLEKETDRQAVETDVILKDRAAAAVSEIYASEGEEGYIEREREALSIAAEHGGLIVSAGADILSRADNADIMHASGYIVFLDVPLSRLVKMKFDDDPKIKNSDDITRLYYERIVTYKSTADLIIDPESPDSIARVLEFMKEKGML